MQRTIIDVEGEEWRVALEGRLSEAESRIAVLETENERLKSDLAGHHHPLTEESLTALSEDQRGLREELNQAEIRMTSELSRIEDLMDSTTPDSLAKESEATLIQEPESLENSTAKEAKKAERTVYRVL